MSRRLSFVCLILPIVLLASACGGESPAPAPQAETGVGLNGDFSGAGPGTLHEARSLPTIDRRLRAIASIAGRVEYTSTSGITDAATRVTGTVFAPQGSAPEGGWPIVALGHATSGIERDCAPSLSPSLLGLVPAVTLLLQAGYVVTVPDYQGLGVDGDYHPYLEPSTAGYNLIDAVRAARKLVPQTSERWVAVGISQGAQASWAANEVDPRYGEGLTLLGSVSLAPPTDLAFFADVASAGELTKDQESVYPSILASIENEDPDFDLDDYRRGAAETDWDRLLKCSVRSAGARADAFARITPDDLRPGSEAATDALRDRLVKMSLPRNAAAAPMLVIYGGKDQFIPVDATDRALAAACGLGDVIDIQLQPDQGHDNLDFSAAYPWIRDRFDDVPAPDTCPRPEPAAPPEEPQVGA